MANLVWIERGELEQRRVCFCPRDTCLHHQIQAQGREIGEFCGKESPGNIETKSNEVDILFLTDESGFSRGWKIHYTSESKMFFSRDYDSLCTAFVNTHSPHPVF